MNETDIKKFFKELEEYNDNINDYGYTTPDDCTCPFKESCAKCGGVNLCTIILRPETIG